MTKTLLACYAHPDDESYGAGGAIAKYAAEGGRCYIVTATSGEVGLDHRSDGDTELGDHRVEELACAAATLGAEPPVILGFPDGGVEDHVEEVTARYLEVFEDLQPDAVLTFDKTGVTGHADHLAIYRAVTDAFNQWDARASRLYYSLLPRAQFSKWAEVLQGAGVESPFEGFPEWDGSPVPPDGSGGPRLAPDDWITTVLEVDGIKKRDAIRCHHSQLGPEAAFAAMPDNIAKIAFGTEYYMLAVGNPAGTSADLFGGS